MLSIASLGILEILVLVSAAYVVLHYIKRHGGPSSEPRNVAPASPAAEKRAIDRQHARSHRRGWLLVVCVIALLVIFRASANRLVTLTAVAVTAFAATRYFSERSLSGSDRGESSNPYCPIERPVAARPIPPLPRRHLAPPPVAQTLASSSTGGFTSVVLPAFGVLALVVAAGSFFVISSGEFSGRPSAVRRMAIDAQHAVAVEETTHFSVKQQPTPAAIKEDARTTVFESEDELNYQPAKTKVYFLTSLHENAADAKREALVRASEYLRRLVSFHQLDRGLVSWTPDPLWVEQTLVASTTLVPHEAPNGEKDPTIHRLRLGLALDEPKVLLVEERYRQDLRTSRALGLGKGYAGTVFILGGLAMVLRLGTGIRPGKENPPTTAPRG